MIPLTITGSAFGIIYTFSSFSIKPAAIFMLIESDDMEVLYISLITARK